MQQRLTVSVVLNVFLLAGAISASTVPLDYRPAGFVDHGTRVAQATELPTISLSSLRRLTFYSDKAMLALFDLVNEDLVAGEGGTISAKTTDAFRSAIERLIGAGDKADLSVDQTAIFFGQEVAVRFSGPIPQLLQGGGGDIDARSLFRGIADGKASAGARQAADAAYLQALQGEIQNMQMSSDEPEVVVAEVVDNVDPEYAARVVIIDGKRTVTVEQGDSLAEYATAFYGDTLLYRSIYSANRDILSDPNLLELGQVVTIPYLQ
jgi:hypothetical protein